jgi:LPXTG-motif cell wall-anchored protein
MDSVTTVRVVAGIIFVILLGVLILRRRSKVH